MEQNNERTEGIVLSPEEAEEFRAYKRRQRVEQVRQAFLKTESEPPLPLTQKEVKSATVQAEKLHLAAIKVTPNLVSRCRGAFLVDAVVGGNGETTTKVKAYEAKNALRDGAKELTLILSHSLLESGKTGELKREISKLVKRAKTALLKVALPEGAPSSQILSVATLVSECGGKMVSVPYFAGAKDLRSELGTKCMLEVTLVPDATAFKELISAGVERITTAHADEIYAALIKEAENYPLSTEVFLAAPSSLTLKSPYAAHNLKISRVR